MVSFVLITFNRTTVECKSLILMLHFYYILPFNRTTVECKSEYTVGDVIWEITFNRTTVECKSGTSGGIKFHTGPLIELQ